MPYSYTTLSQAKTFLASRLYDPTMTFWTDAELTAYITEGLRTWNAYAAFWRAEFILTLSSAIWYDITDASIAPNTLRPFTVTDAELYNIIEYHLLEPATGPIWTGSLQFNAADMMQAVQRRRDELLSNTTCTVRRALVPAVPGRTFLDDKTIDIRRIAWLPVTSPVGYTNSPLLSSDVWAQQSFENDFTVQIPGTPATYRHTSEPPLSFDTDIPPAVPGQYEVLSVDAGPSLSTTPQTLAIPDDFAWVLKWGALSDMLSIESNAKDAFRAEYCNARYQQGIALLKTAPAILSARINNIPTAIEAVQNADYYRTGWQAETAGTPNLVLIAGLNQIGFAGPPDAGPYSATLSVVQNAPIPVNGSDFIQLGRDEYDVLLDYCVHLAAFKMGGAEFQATIPLFQRFMLQAEKYNQKLRALGPFTETIYKLSTQDSEANPVFAGEEKP